MNAPTPWAWLTDLLDCAVMELDTQAIPLQGAPGRQFVSAGQVAWDDCCDSGGQVWTRIIGANPVDPLPVFKDVPTSCSSAMGLHIGVGIVRCAHTIDDQGHAPPADDLTAEARQATADMVDLRRAIVCCIENQKRLILRQWTPLMGGGCVGGEWDVWVNSSFAGGGSPGSP